MIRDGVMVPVDQGSLKKKTAVSSSWILLDHNGNTTILDVDKYVIMRRVQIHARDLRILDPMLSYPSTILGREKVIVLNLEHIKAIITAEEVLLRDPLDDNVIPIVEELQRRLVPDNPISQGQGEEDDHPGVGNDIDTGKENEFPFEFRALEVALEAICSFLDARTTELETDTYPALDEWTAKISNRNLDRVRKLKSAMTRLTNRVQKVRDELEQLLDDDDDMADLYLSRKLVVASSPVSDSVVPNWFHNSPTTGSKISRTTSRASAATIQEENDVEELEMLLEVRDELEQLLDDDDDMADLYLSRKLAMASAPVSDSAVPNWFHNSPTIGRAAAATLEDNDVEELEMLLEAHYTQIDGTLNKLITLREYIDDTKDYINLQLSNHRNKLIQLALILSSSTVCLSIYDLVTSIFGMKIPYTWNHNHGYMFKWVVVVSGIAFALFFSTMILYARRRGLFGSWIINIK